MVLKYPVPAKHSTSRQVNLIKKSLSHSDIDSTGAVSNPDIVKERYKIFSIDYKTKGTIWASDEIMGTGAQQLIPHPLGVVPGMVIVNLLGYQGVHGLLEGYEYGTHTSTDVKITASDNIKYRVVVMR